MDVSPQVRIGAQYLGAPQEPPGEPDPMRAEIEQRPAPSSLHIPEPLRVRTEVLLALFNQVHFAKGAGVCHLFRLAILGGEEKLLGIEQQHTVGAAGLDHRVSLGRCDTERLLADNMFARPPHGNGHFAMQSVGSGNGDRLNSRVSRQLFVIGINLRNLVAIGETLRVCSGGRSHRHNGHIVFNHADRGCVAIRLELRANDAYAYWSIFHVNLSWGNPQILKGKSKTESRALLDKFRGRLYEGDVRCSWRASVTGKGGCGQRKHCAGEHFLEA